MIYILLAIITAGFAAEAPHPDGTATKPHSIWKRLIQPRTRSPQKHYTARDLEQCTQNLIKKYSRQKIRFQPAMPLETFQLALDAFKEKRPWDDDVRTVTALIMRHLRSSDPNTPANQSIMAAFLNHTYLPLSMHVCGFQRHSLRTPPRDVYHLVIDGKQRMFFCSNHWNTQHDPIMQSFLSIHHKDLCSKGLAHLDVSVPVFRTITTVIANLMPKNALLDELSQPVSDDKLFQQAEPVTLQTLGVK